MKMKPTISRTYPVPRDFPMSPLTSLSSPAEYELHHILVEFQGAFYPPMFTPPEVHERWQWCEGLVPQFVFKCRTNEKGKFAHLTQAEILDQYLTSMMKTDFGSPAELRWVIRNVAFKLGWPLPDSAREQE